MYKIYLLESLKTKKWYVGYTPAGLSERLNKHNGGLVSSTKPYRPWKLIYSEHYLNRSDALGREAA